MTPSAMSSPARTPVPIHHRKRFWVVLIVIAGLLALAARVASNLTTVRASAVRAVHQGDLRTIALGMRLYQQETGHIGTMGDLIAAGHVTQDQAALFASVVYNANSGPAGPRLLFVQRTPEPLVLKGDTWGGPGETASHDIPACRNVMFDDLTVSEVVEDDYQKTHAPQITLKP